MKSILAKYYLKIGFMQQSVLILSTKLILIGTVPARILCIRTLKTERREKMQLIRMAADNSIFKLSTKSI